MAHFSPIPRALQRCCLRPLAWLLLIGAALLGVPACTGPHPIPPDFRDPGPNGGFANDRGADAGVGNGTGGTVNAGGDGDGALDLSGEDAGVDDPAADGGPVQQP